MENIFTEDEIEKIKEILIEKMKAMGFSYDEVYQEDESCLVYIFHNGQAKLPVIVSNTKVDEDYITIKYGSFRTAYTSDPIYIDNNISDINLSELVYNKQKPPQKNLKFKSIR